MAGQKQEYIPYPASWLNAQDFDRELLDYLNTCMALDSRKVVSSAFFVEVILYLQTTYKVWTK
jgi:hypothetical protein